MIKYIQKQYHDIFDDGYEVDSILKNISLKKQKFEFISGETLIFLMNFKHVLIVQHH